MNRLFGVLKTLLAFFQYFLPWRFHFSLLFHHTFCRLIDWLIDRLIDLRSIDRLIDWLIDWLIDFFHVFVPSISFYLFLLIRDFSYEFLSQLAWGDAESPQSPVIAHGAMKIQDPPLVGRHLISANSVRLPDNVIWKPRSRRDAQVEPDGDNNGLGVGPSADSPLPKLTSIQADCVNPQSIKVSVEFDQVCRSFLQISRLQHSKKAKCHSISFKLYPRGSFFSPSHLTELYTPRDILAMRLARTLERGAVCGSKTLQSPRTRKSSCYKGVWTGGAMASGLQEIWRENRERGRDLGVAKRHRDREAWPLAPPHLHMPLSCWDFRRFLARKKTNFCRSVSKLDSSWCFFLYFVNSD